MAHLSPSTTASTLTMFSEPTLARVLSFASSRLERLPSRALVRLLSSTLTVCLVSSMLSIAQDHTTIKTFPNGAFRVEMDEHHQHAGRHARRVARGTADHRGDESPTRLQRWDAACTR